MTLGEVLADGKPAIMVHQRYTRMVRGTIDVLLTPVAILRPPKVLNKLLQIRHQVSLLTRELVQTLEKNIN